MTISWFNNGIKSDSIVHTVDDNFKVITNVKGNQNEEMVVVDVSKLKNATSQPKISIAGINFEVFYYYSNSFIMAFFFMMFLSYLLFFIIKNY